MSLLLITAIISITLALVFYSIGVWIIWLIPYLTGMFLNIF